MHTSYKNEDTACKIKITWDNQSYIPAADTINRDNHHHQFNMLSPGFFFFSSEFTDIHEGTNFSGFVLFFFF